VSSVELPIFVVAIGEEYVGERDEPEGAMTCFGTEDAARHFIGVAARQSGKPESLYRIVEYGFTGRVLEG
jgi:hypothetical protein